MRVTKLLSAVALIAIAGSLAACGSSSSSESQEPPPPPQIYVVKHMAADGSVIATHRATYAIADGGCVKFEAVGDPKNLQYRVACGNVSVNPEEK